MVVCGGGSFFAGSGGGGSFFTGSTNRAMAAARALYRTFSTKKFNQPRKIPSSIDWRKKGAVTKVMNQGDCAIAATGAVEGLLKIKKGKLIRLSTQQLVDNIYKGKWCCKHGSMAPVALDYIKKHGITTAAHYHFIGRCKSGQLVGNGPIYRIKGYERLKKVGDENAMQNIVAQQPVVAAVNARRWPRDGWKTKKIYSGHSSDFTNHEVLIVGYGNEDGTPYWLIKNSWGKSFGDAGYVKIRRGVNAFGIANYVWYPTMHYPTMH